MLYTIKLARWGVSVPLLSEMHLTLLSSQNAAGETNIGSCGKKGANGA